MRPGPCSLCTECFGRSKLFKPLTRRRVRKMSPERLAVEPPEPPKSPGHGAGACKGPEVRGAWGGRDSQLGCPRPGCTGGHVSGVQSRWAPALMTELTGKVRARGRRSQEWMGTHYGKRPRSWTQDGSFLGQKISAPGHSLRLTQLLDHWSRASEH